MGATKLQRKRAARRAKQEEQREAREATDAQSIMFALAFGILVISPYHYHKLHRRHAHEWGLRGSNHMAARLLRETDSRAVRAFVAEWMQGGAMAAGGVEHGRAT
jgi:hypothetical protein